MSTAVGNQPNFPTPLSLETPPNDPIMAAGDNRTAQGVGKGIPNDLQEKLKAQDNMQMMAGILRTLEDSLLLLGNGAAGTDKIAPGTGNELLATGSTTAQKAAQKGESASVTIGRPISISSQEMGIDIFTCMALFQKIAQQLRNSSREVRTSEMSAQINQMQQAADEIRNAAASRFAAAIVQNSMQIAGGAIQMGTSAAALKGATAGKDALANAQLARGQAAGQIMGGIGGLAAAPLNLAADLADARRAEADMHAKEHEMNVQHANDMMQQMMDVIRDINEKMGSIQQAQIEANRGIVRNI